MNLTTQSFISLFDSVNEQSKSEILSELISKVSLDGIRNHPVVIQKYKDEILKNENLTQSARHLITKTNDSFFLHQCYSEPRFLAKFNLRLYQFHLWKSYYIFEDRIYITSLDVFPDPATVKLPFNFKKLVIEGDMSIDNIYVDEYEHFEGKFVIYQSKKWYESLNISNLNAI